MKKGFITNKYTISVFILLAILAVDVYLHKGMSRVMLPESFTDKRMPQKNLPFCKASLIIKGKKWRKAVNNLDIASKIDASLSGFESDIHFDTSKNSFFVYHDSSSISNLSLETMFATIFQRKKDASVWLDFKNLSLANAKQALTKLCEIREEFALQKRIIVESSTIQALTMFCDSNFYTSYYTPFFNPYNESEEKIVETIDNISSLLKKYPVSALSGYYFQTPFLMKFFPDFPILTWADDAHLSIVGNIFKYQLEQQKNISIILYPSDN